MKLRERVRRWWKPGEYDDEHPVDNNDGFPLSDEDRNPRPLVGESGAAYLGAGIGVEGPDDDFRRP